MLRGRTYESGVEDIEDLANSLGVNKFYLAAVSGGGPYALAAANLIPLRLRGILLLSAAGSPGEDSEWRGSNSKLDAATVACSLADRIGL